MITICRLVRAGVTGSRACCRWGRAWVNDKAKDKGRDRDGDMGS